MNSSDDDDIREDDIREDDTSEDIEAIDSQESDQSSRHVPLRPKVMKPSSVERLPPSANVQRAVPVLADRLKAPSIAPSADDDRDDPAIVVTERTAVPFKSQTTRSASAHKGKKKSDTDAMIIYGSLVGLAVLVVVGIAYLSLSEAPVSTEYFESEDIDYEMSGDHSYSRRSRSDANYVPPEAYRRKRLQRVDDPWAADAQPGDVTDTQQVQPNTSTESSLNSQHGAPGDRPDDVDPLEFAKDDDELR